MKKISSGVFFLLFYSSLLAQYTNLKFENLSTIDGLSSSTCVEIHQDQDGFLWFGTIDGLNKYNGHEFTVYRSVINDPHSISSNRIYCIEEDNLGRLWIDEVFLDKVTKGILDNISDPDFTLENLLEQVGMSRSHFFRKINSLTGQNPSNFIRTVRLKYAAGLLVTQQHSIKEISYMAGFNSSAYFSKTFRELFGKTPQQYIEGYSNEKTA
jgi:AraC-like DNA-binding protein